MSATIYYLRPFEREDLSKTDAELPAEAEAAAYEHEAAPSEAEAATQERRPARKRTMPCGRNSRFKKRMDGTVVPREER
jgi:hypothetical protein